LPFGLGSSPFSLEIYPLKVAGIAVTLLEAVIPSLEVLAAAPSLGRGFALEPLNPVVVYGCTFSASSNADLSDFLAECCGDSILSAVRFSF